MDNSARKYFISYSRTDTAIATRLAEQLRKNHVNLWIDQLDIPAGDRWDSSIEDALEACPGLIVLLSKTSVASDNVLDEVSYALEENDQVIPVLLEPCDIPFRLRRLQYIDLSTNYEDGFNRLLQNIKRENRQDYVNVTQKAHSQVLSSENSTLANSTPADSTTKVHPSNRCPIVNPTLSKASPKVPKALLNISDEVEITPPSVPPSVIQKIAVEKASAEKTGYLATKDYLVGGILVFSMLSCILTLVKVSNRVAPPITPPPANKTTLKYRPKTQDPPQIKRLIDNPKISSKFNVQEEAMTASNHLTNSISFGSKVPHDKVKRIARQLIEQGVEIKVIQQQDNWQQDEWLTTLWLKHNPKGTRNYCDQNWTIESLDMVESFDLASDNQQNRLSGCAPQPSRSTVTALHSHRDQQ